MKNKSNCITTLIELLSVGIFCFILLISTQPSNEESFNITQTTNSNITTNSLHSSGLIFNTTSSCGTSSEYGYDTWSDGINLYTCGYFWGSQEDISVQKWDQNGVLIWNITWSTGGYEHAYSLFGEGSFLYVCGYTDGMGSGSRDLLVLKLYTTNGTVLWSRLWGATYAEEGHGIWVNESTIYVTGFKMMNYDGNWDLVLVKWDTNGTFLWGNTWGTSSDQNGFGIWSNGINVYTTGYAYNVGAGSMDIILIEWNSIGSVNWYRTWGTASEDRGTGLWGDESFLYTCGQWYNGNNNDALVVCWDYAGNQIWNATTGCPKTDYAADIWGNGSSLYTVGYYNIQGEWNEMFEMYMDQSDIQMLKWDKNTGALIGNNTWGGPSNDYGYGIWCNENSVYTCGTTNSYGSSSGDISFIKWDAKSNLLKIISSPIIIDGSSPTQNWSNCPYVNGSGTFSDPYILQNLQIDASGGTNCISISNTNQFYRIVNCILSNTGNTLGCAGILLNNANNGVIQKCTLFNNQYGAINAKKCDNLLINDNNLTANYFGVLINCNHSIVSNNLVINNPVGIQTESGTSTYNCTIIHNTCIGGSAGIRVWGKFHNVSNNTCSSNTQCGILASGFNHTMKYNTISNCQWGIWLPDGICDYNSISYNTCVNNTQYGIYLSGYYDEFSKVGDYSEFNLVSNNNCSLNTICGVFIFGSPQNNLFGNIGTILLNVYPDPPQNVNAIPGNYQIQLNWQPPLSNGGLSITGYILYRGLTEESKMLLVELGNVTNYLDTGLVNGQIYYYQLVAQNNAGLSLNSTGTFAQSGNVSTVPQINSPLDQSWDFGTTNHFIEWLVIDDTIGTTSCLIYQNGTNVDTGIWVSGNSFSIDIDGLSVGSYNYTCIAFDGLGESTQDTIIVHVQNVNPLVNHPSDMIFVLGTSGHSIIWTPTDSSTFATPKYSIWKNGTCVLIGNWSSGNNIPFSVDDLFEGIWNIEIQINDGYLSGNNSDVVIVTVISNTPPSLTAPADQSIIMETTGGTISWMVTDSEIGSTSYTIYRNNALVGTGSWVNGSIISTTLDGLSLGSYNFTLIVNDGLSLGITQDTVWITIFTIIIPTPTLNPIIPNPNTNGTILLSWSSVVLADNYSIYQYSGLVTTLNGSVIKLATLSQLSYDVSGLLDGTYYFVVIASNMSGSSNLSNCESVVVKLPELAPQVVILQPTNGSIFLTINNLNLYYYVENIPQIQTVWYMVNSSGHWVAINGNTTFNVLYPGTHSIIVSVQSIAGQNYTSNPAVFKVFIENDPNALLEIAMVVISGAFQSGETMEIQVSISNKGSVDLANVVLYFDRSTNQYQFAPNSKNNYTISILSINQMSVFTIKVILNQTTSELLIRGQITAESFHKSFEFPLKPESTTDPLVYTFSAVGVAAVAGGSFYGLKKKNAKGTKSLLGGGHPDKHGDKNEPTLDRNNDMEFTF